MFFVLAVLMLWNGILDQNQALDTRVSGSVTLLGQYNTFSSRCPHAKCKGFYGFQGDLNPVGPEGFIV